MKAIKLEDAHYFKERVKGDLSLINSKSDTIHAEYVAYVNENYVLKSEITEVDHINNKPDHLV